MPPPVIVIHISDTESGDDTAAASSALSTSAAERITSTLTTQTKVDAVCRNHDVPTEFAARPAGELRACSEPPRGSVCVYAHMLETGVRFPLHDFFCDALTHFHLAPGQLSINGWRVLVGFVALCHEAGVVPPSMALLRHFFQLYNRNDWYYFRCRADAGVLFTGTSYAQSEREWKGGFFFLTSQESWRCPVRWGKPPYKSSAAGPVLTTYQKQSAEKLLRVHGAACDLRAYLRETDLAAALSANLAGAPPPPQPSPRSTVAEVVDPPVRDMTHSMPVENTAAPAAWTEQVKSEAHGDTHPLAGKKRRREEVTGADGIGCAAPVACPRSPHSPVPETHDGESADWKAARKVLEGIVTPWRERHFAASKPSDLLASSYVAVLQAANYATFSMTYALEREEKVLARERDNLALWEQVEKEKAARQAVEAELEMFLRSEEYTRLLAEQALTGYLRGAEEMKRVVLQHYPHLDAGKLELPVD